MFWLERGGDDREEDTYRTGVHVNSPAYDMPAVLPSVSPVIGPAH
jgi:hypothetical protein